MIDVILYIADFPTLVGYLNAHHPELLERDEEGDLVMPPVVVGFARTPAVVNGDALMAYMRLTEKQAEQWRDTPGVEILGEAPFTGPGTADAVYAQVLDAPARAATYSAVYPQDPYTVDDPELGEMTITPPVKFGVMAGA